MNETGFHFAETVWLWGLLVIPAVLAWLRYSKPYRRQGMESKYADEALLPYLIGQADSGSSRHHLRPIIGWSLAWTMLILAMAGPRWDFRQVSLFSPGVDLVILLDISRSMNVADVSPSRLVRARQEIEDLISEPHAVRIGVVAFATVSHVVAPITEDRDGIRHQLPAISSQLVHLQGSRLTDALLRAEHLFKGQPDDTAHNLLLISDGDFADSDLGSRVEALNKAGIKLHVLAMGTDGGGPVPGPRGNYMLDRNGQAINSRLDKDGLQRLAELGGGIFQVADYRASDTENVLKAVLKHGEAKQDESAITTIWNERFYWLLIPAMILLLVLYRPRGSIRSLDKW